MELNSLELKRGRNAQFKNAQERDNWLRECIKTTQQSITSEENQINTLQQTIEQSADRLDQIEQ